MDWHEAFFALAYALDMILSFSIARSYPKSTIRSTFVAGVAVPYAATITRPKVEWALTIFDGSVEGASSPFYVKCAARLSCLFTVCSYPIGASLQDVTWHIILLHRLLERPDHSRTGSSPMFVPDRLKLPLRKGERWYVGISLLLIAVAITVMHLNSSKQKCGRT